MLDAWIIEEVLRRERRLRDEAVQAELPALPSEAPAEAPRDRESDDDERQDERRGVVVVDYRV